MISLWNGLSFKQNINIYCSRLIANFGTTADTSYQNSRFPNIVLFFNLINGFACTVLLNLLFANMI